MRALSIQQPWAYAILHLGKDIENRSWHTTFRGPFLIHAGKKIDKSGIESLRDLGHHIDEKDLATGAIVGRYSISDCVTESRSKWFFGKYGFVLGTTRPLFKGRDIEDGPVAYEHPVTCRGKLGFFTPPEDRLKTVADFNGDRAVWPICSFCASPLQKQDDDLGYHLGCWSTRVTG